MTPGGFHAAPSEIQAEGGIADRRVRGGQLGRQIQASQTDSLTHRMAQGKCDG